MKRCDSTLALLENEQLESDDCSSGYGSTHDISDNEITQIICGDETITQSKPSDNEEMNPSHQENARSANDVMNHDERNCCQKASLSYRNTSVLSSHLKMIISLPELCDISFEVGPQKVKVYGVKAILGARSRVMYNLILRKRQEAELQKNIGKKHQKTPLVIPVTKYKPEDFKKLIEYMHCGSVHIDEKNLPGLLCGASQFELEELEDICWEFVDYCKREKMMQALLKPLQFYSKSKTGQVLLEKISCSLVRSVSV